MQGRSRSSSGSRSSTGRCAASTRRGSGFRICDGSRHEWAYVPRMRSILKAGILLGALTVGWTLVMGVTGWYKHPTLLNLFWVVIPLEIAVLVWALRRTRNEG